MRFINKSFKKTNSKTTHSFRRREATPVVQVGGLGGSLLQEVEAADRPDGQLRRRPQELRRLPGNRLVSMLQNLFPLSK